MTAKAAPENANKSWFDISVSYAYFEGGNGSFSSTLGSSIISKLNVSQSNTQYVKYETLINYTFNVNLKQETDDQVDYYLVQVESDKGPVMSERLYLGTYGDADKSQVLISSGGVYSNESGWFGLEVRSSGSGLIMPHNTTTTSGMTGVGGRGFGTTGSSNAAMAASAIMEANTITVTVTRLGWVTFTGNSTTETQANDTVATVQLQRFQNGFIYNNLVPQNELSRIADLAEPVTWDPQTNQTVLNLNP